MNTYRFDKIEVKGNTPKAVPTGRVAIVDVSGSMQWSMERLKVNLSNWIDELAVGDVVSVAWFSGEGNQFEWFIRNAEIGQDRTRLHALIDRKLYARNTTCFSEVLGSLPTIFSEMGELPIQLTFFTDGYPVVNNTRKEEAAIFAAIETVALVPQEVLLVGYRHHNVALMAKMAHAFGASLIHASDLADFRDAQMRLLDKHEQRYQVEYETEPMLAFQITADGYEYVKWEDGKLYCKPGTIWTVLDEPDDSIELTPAYIAAAAFTELAQADVALGILGDIGDIALIDQLNNALLPDEILNVREACLKAAFHRNWRYTQGKDTNYVPKADAFCVLDLIDMLVEGDNYLELDTLDYHSIGRKIVNNSAISFTRNPHQLVEMKDLVWHTKRLNLSLRVKKHGIAAFEYGGNSYRVPTFVWRTYTLIADGKPNVTELPVVLDAPTHNKLIELGVVDPCDEGETSFIDLTKIPILNRSGKRPSAKELGELVIEELVLMATQRAINHNLPKREKTASEAFTTVYGEELAAWMALEGLTEGGFSPKSQCEPATDYYVVPTFSAYVKGMKTIPNPDDVRKLIEKGGKLNLVKRAIANWLDEDDPQVLEQALANVRRDIRQCRSKIQRIKFELLLAKKWFAEFTSYDQREIQIDGGTVVFEFDEEKVVM